MAKKLKGKEWFSIVAPKMFNEKILGDTPAGIPDMIIGRKIETPLVNLINDSSKFYLKLKFRINKIKENKAYTEFAGMECLRDYLSRMIRHGVKRIDNVYVLATKDNKTLRIKTLTLTSKKAKKNIEIAMRKFIHDRLKEEIEKITFDEFLEKVINDSIKRTVLEEGSKIYPINSFEMRKVELLA